MIDSLVDTPSSCNSCESYLIRNLGRLRKISGNINLGDPGNIYHCAECGIFFRYPYPSLRYLTQAYEGLPATLWEGGGNRQDFTIAAGIIEKMMPIGSILDVGCFRGDFLSMLPGCYQKYGLEISLAARNIAQERGITLVGTSIEEIDTEDRKFNIITLIDVIEHLPDPLAALRKIATLLLPGGLVIISTGNTDAATWKLMRRDYWYYYPEHVSFFNPKWFFWAVARLGRRAELKQITKFSYIKGGTLERWMQFSYCLGFWIMDKMKNHSIAEQLLRKMYPFSKISQWSSPPETYSYRDHMIIVLKLSD